MRILYRHLHRLPGDVLGVDSPTCLWEKIDNWLGAVMRGVGQKGLSRELCGIISWDYCFKREAHLKEERARQSQNGPFPTYYCNGKKDLWRKQTAQSNGLEKFWKTWKEYELQLMMFRQKHVPVTHLWTWSTIIFFFRSLGLVSTTATEVIGCIFDHSRSESLHLKGTTDTLTVYSTVSWLSSIHTLWLGVNLHVLCFGWRAAVDCSCSTDSCYQVLLCTAVAIIVANKCQLVC